MDAAALRRRCPRARPLGPARLRGYEFVLMGNGYASIRRAPAGQVHGVLFDLALSDVPPLDRYEEVGRGLYIKSVLPVVRADGRACRALVYLGTDRRIGGTPPPGYMEGVVAAAIAAGLPRAHLAALSHWLPRAASPSPAPSRLVGAQ